MVLHLNEMGRGSVGMKQCYEQLLSKTILLRFVKSNNCCWTLREMWFTYLFYIWFCLVHLGKARESLWQCLVLNANGLKSILFIGSALHNNGVVDQWRWNISTFTFRISCLLVLCLLWFILVEGKNVLMSSDLSCVAAELFVNGEIVQRSPERQRRVEPVPQRAADRPRYNDRTRYARRRENQRWADQRPE